jgi:leader peptidase (prepilin peptidase)/N-methyltransferase
MVTGVADVLLIMIAFAALVGAAVGSFGGVVASRGLRKSVRGRSQCDSCGRNLQWFETVPFFSFLALRGRCRSCGASMGWAPLLWEIGGAAIALGIALPIALVRGL